MTAFGRLRFVSKPEIAPMYFNALATDYDGTIAHDGMVTPATAEALRRLKESGRRLVMVTGRELPDLQRVCPYIDLFDRVVAENGALLYRPDTKEERPLGPPPPPEFVARLRALDIRPLSVGPVIVASWEPNEAAVLGAIRDLGLDLQIIFNKGAVMVLPSGVNKASGLHAALDELRLSAHNTVAVGDAENDLAFMRMAGCGVAVGNALDAVKDAADAVMTAPRGEGVEELAAILIEDEAPLLEAAVVRHSIRLGTDAAGGEILLRPSDGDVLIAGQSGGGKSTLAAALLERMTDHGFQFCILDPEGDYADLEGAVVFGDSKTAARPEAAIEALKDTDTNVVVNMLGIGVEERPTLFAALFPAIHNQRVTTGRPHWVLIDEAHHMVPKDRAADEIVTASRKHPTLFVTVHPDALSKDVLGHLGAVIGIGNEAGDIVSAVCRITGEACPPLPEHEVGPGHALFWNRRAGANPLIVAFEPPRRAQKRHTRKYAEGELGEDKSFYFTGPDAALRLRAQNLMMFLQIADGVDEATFMHHLRAGDYSRWFRDDIKDPDLAAETEKVEADSNLRPSDARARLREAVETRYTAPA